MSNQAGAYDARGKLIATTTVGDDGTLAEPLHVPPGGFVAYTLPAPGGLVRAVSAMTVTRLTELPAHLGAATQRWAGGPR